MRRSETFEPHVLRPKMQPYLVRAVALGAIAVSLIVHSNDTRFIGLAIAFFLVFEGLARVTSSMTLTLDGFAYRSFNRTISHSWSDIETFVNVEQRMLFGLIPVNRYLGWNYVPGYRTSRLAAATHLLTRSFRLADGMVKPMGFHVPTLVSAMNQFLELSRNRTLAEEYAAQAQEVAETPTILVSRRARLFGHPWFESRSWFGGRPRLGSIPWPRDRRGVPMAFAAQFDLAEVAAVLPNSPLPTTGSLAFFLGDRPLVYVPPQSESSFTEVPSDAANLAEVGYGGTGTCCWPGDPLGPKSFPFWPVDFRVLGTFPPIADRESDEADELAEARHAQQVAAVEQSLTRRPSLFTAREAWSSLGDTPHPDWWHSAIHFADCLRVALDFAVGQRQKVLRQSPLGASPSHRQAIAEMESRLPTFRQFVGETLHWVRDRDPWMLMEPADVKQLHEIIERARTEFVELTRWQTPRSYEDLATVTLLAIATAEDRAYATLPAPIRRLINEKFLLPIDHWHQIFGDPIDIQGNAVAENEGHYLLLRLTHDDMMHWSFGDNGAYHFFIPPDQLAARNWSAGIMTFECH